MLKDMRAPAHRRDAPLLATSHICFPKAFSAILPMSLIRVPPRRMACPYDMIKARSRSNCQDILRAR